jgi:hypothetical protein
VDFVNRRTQRGVKFGIAHLVTQVFEQCAAEAGDDAAVLGQFDARFRPLVTARERNNAQHLGVVDQARRTCPASTGSDSLSMTCWPGQRIERS